MLIVKEWLIHMKYTVINIYVYVVSSPKKSYSYS